MWKSGPEFTPPWVAAAVSAGAAVVGGVLDEPPQATSPAAAGYQDDSATTSANCDVFYHANVPKMGFQMVDELSDMGAKTFVLVRILLLQNLGCTVAFLTLGHSGGHDANLVVGGLLCRSGGSFTF